MFFLVCCFAVFIVELLKTACDTFNFFNVMSFILSGFYDLEDQNITSMKSIRIILQFIISYIPLTNPFK